MCKHKIRDKSVKVLAVLCISFLKSFFINQIKDISHIQVRDHYKTIIESILIP